VPPRGSVGIGRAPVCYRACDVAVAFFVIVKRVVRLIEVGAPTEIPARGLRRERPRRRSMGVLREKKSAAGAEEGAHPPPPVCDAGLAPGAGESERDKGIGWMPWHREAMKDVARCEKLGGGASAR
jgi:hypothetical protein